MSTLSPSHSAPALPTELILEILELAALNDSASSRRIARVWRVTREYSLKCAYTMVAQPELGTPGSIWTLPEHLRPYVRNVWTKPAGPVDGSTVRTSWIWRHVPDVAVSLSVLFAAIPHAYEHGVTPPLACKRLTLLASDDSARIGLVPPEARHATHFAALTHLRVRMDGPVISLVETFVRHLPVLTHLAIDVYYNVFHESSLHFGFAMKASRPSTMVVLAIELSSELDDFMNILTAYVARDIYAVPMSSANASRYREQWEKEANGAEEDIWGQAIKLRELVTERRGS